MVIQKFSGDRVAYVLNAVDLSLNCLLQYFVDYFEVAGHVGTLKAAGQVDEDIETGYEYHGSLSGSGNFNEFLDVLDAYSCQIDSYFRQ